MYQNWFEEYEKIVGKKSYDYIFLTKEDLIEENKILKKKIRKLESRLKNEQVNSQRTKKSIRKCSR